MLISLDISKTRCRQFQVQHPEQIDLHWRLTASNTIDIIPSRGLRRSLESRVALVKPRGEKHCICAVFHIYTACVCGRAALVQVECRVDARRRLGGLI